MSREKDTQGHPQRKEFSIKYDLRGVQATVSLRTVIIKCPLMRP